jgi:hypothetical protein
VIELAPAWTAMLPGWASLAPVVHAGRVHVRAGGRLVAVDPSTGIERWCTEVDSANDTGRVLLVCDDVIVTSRHQNRMTTLIGVDLDGNVAWETPTGSVVVDAHGVVAGHFVAFGARGLDTVMQTVHPATGEIVAELPVPRRPDRFVVAGDRLLGAQRGVPGLFSMRADGSDVRDEAAEPVAQVSHQPPRLVLSTRHEGAKVVEHRSERLALGWRREIGSPVIATSPDAVLVFDPDDSGLAPRLLHLADGSVWVGGAAMVGEPEAATVLDELVAVQTITSLHLLARDDLAPIAEIPLAVHAVQIDGQILVTRMDQLEAYELRTS